MIWYGPSCALLYSGAWSGGALAGRLRGGRPVLVTGLGTLVVACGLFFQDPRLVAGAQVATIFGVTVLNIVLTRYLHDAMPSAIRAGVSSVVSTIGYGVFVPAALAFGLFSRGHGIFAASAFVVVPLGAMCLAVARGQRWALQPAVTRNRRWAQRPAEQPQPVTQPGYAGPARAYGGPKVYRVGDPAKSPESRANTHSGRRANTLFSVGSTISGP
jgi:hypothetical protein